MLIQVMIMKMATLTHPCAKRSVISLERKRKILQIESGKKKAQICKEYGLTSSTVNTIKKAKERILQQKHFAEKCKRMRKSYTEDVEDALFIWLKQA